MAAEELNVIAQREQFCPNGVQQGRCIAIGKISPPDGTLEQHIPHKGDAHRGIDEHDMSRRMARAMQHIKGDAGDIHLIAFFKPAVGCDGAAFQPVFRALRDQAFQQKRIRKLRAFNRHIAERFGQFRRAAGMVHMAMGQQDAVNRNARFGNGGFDLRDIAAWVYDHATLGFLIPDQGTVLLEGRDGDDGCGE